MAKKKPQPRTQDLRIDAAPEQLAKAIMRGGAPKRQKPDSPKVG